MSQNVTLPATISAAQSLAVEALASNESEQWQQWMEADRVRGHGRRRSGRPVYTSAQMLENAQNCHFWTWFKAR